MRAILLTILALSATEPALAASRPVLVAARPIARGALLTGADVALSPRPFAPADALANTAQAVGRVASRAFAPGAPIRASALAAPVVTRRGEGVTMRAEQPGVVVEMAGVARLDGREGALAEALNPSSGRRIRGRVAPDGALVVR